MLLTAQERRERSYRGRAQAILVFVLCAMLLSVSLRTGWLRPTERLIYQAVYQPLRDVLHWPLRTLDNGVQHYRQQAHDDGQLQRVLEENRVLRAQTQLLAHLQAENRRLRMLMDSVLDVRLPVSVAELRDTAIDGYREVVTVGRGQKDDVYVHQAVIDPYGLVGQVVEVFPDEARVMLISDARSRVPVYVARTQQRAVVAGDARIGSLRLPEMPLDSDLQEGDVLISSGLGGVFPRGYPVARVKRVIRDPRLSFMQVQLESVAHLSSMLEVLLLDRPTSNDPLPVLSAGPVLPPDLTPAVDEDTAVPEPGNG